MYDLFDQAFLARAARVTDPDFASVSLLLHGDGANGSTSIIDSSSAARTVTAVGNAQISTAQSKFGGASIAFDGNGDYLTVPAASAFDIESADYTVELWFYVNANPGNVSNLFRRTIINNYANPESGWSIQLRGTSTAYTAISLGDGDIDVINASATVQQNTWHHLGFTKSGSDCKLFFNGSQIGSTASRPTFFASSTRTLFIGRLNAVGVQNWDFPGFIDDIRITKGVARTITVPTAPFPDA